MGHNVEEVRMSTLDLQKVVEILRSEGWDALLTEDVVARRDGPDGVWNLYADRAGRVRLEVTREAAMPEGGRMTLEGREYRAVREVHEVINVLTAIEKEDELVEVLHTFADIIRRRLWATTNRA